MIYGVAPVMTDFVFALVRLSLGCTGLDRGARGIKLFGDHGEAVKMVLMTNLGVPEESITMCRVDRD